MPAAAQQVTLRVHHFLPPTSSAQVKLIQPWCDKIAKESADRLKCQIFPSMQMGGSPPQLFDQARDGVECREQSARISPGNAQQVVAQPVGRSDTPMPAAQMP